METAALMIRNIRLCYQDTRIVDDFSLSLKPQELGCLLGPSGCGKSTLLRAIAGFQELLEGEIWLDNQRLSTPHQRVLPEHRGVGMVFQDYALFPHLDAWRNACFGLRRGQDSSRASWLLELLGLKGLERRYPHELSGGQRQRLALARAVRLHLKRQVIVYRGRTAVFE